MNTKLSGAQLVLVEIKHMGRNYLPLVEYMRGRMVKFIDFCPTTYLPGIAGQSGVSDTDDMYLTIMNEYGNTELHRSMPLVRFDYTATIGVRQPVCAKISMQTSFIDCQNANNVGKVVALMFYYDLPEYSSRNTTDAVMTDAISIPLTTAIRYNQLPDTDRLTGKRFRRILLGTPSVTPDLQTGLNYSQLQNCFITLRKGTYNVVENMPVILLYQMEMLEKSEWANIIFDFQNSYITIGGAGTIPNVEDNYIGKSIFFNLQYEAK
ncbi:hypothetical protein J6A32_07350 [Methanocorpusculum sp.]|nr:hypothetical protein [Methanocorpusculum sp.]